MYQSYKEFDEKYKFAEKAGFQLTPLQEQDVNQFKEWQVSLCAADVGGGKTAMSTVTSLLRDDVELTLVICPPILIGPWSRWLNRVSERVVAYKGTPGERKKLYDQIPTARWCVMSIDIFRREYEKLLPVITGRQLEIIVDEAQNLKNVESKLWQFVYLLRPTSYIQLLSGTPTSTPMDFYAYIALKTPDAYRHRVHFEMLHVEDRDHFKRVTGWKNLDTISKHYQVNTIARSKEELHGYSIKPLFPDCQYELSKKHKELYIELLDQQLLLLPDGTKIDATSASRLYHAMQQIVVNFDYFSGDPKNRSAAYDLLDLTIEQTDCLTPGRSKLIVWTVYRLTSRSVWQYLLSKGIKAVAAFSETDSNKSFNQFMEDDSVRILVAQPRSAGVGLNPQGVCWETLALETSTRPMDTIQANGRVDRVGQKHTPSIRIGVAEDTIQVGLLAQLLCNDDLITRIQGDKKALRDVLLGR